MKYSKLLSGLLLVTLVASPALAGNEAQFSRLIVFGDSLSDTGNVFILTGGQSVPPYSGIDPVSRIPGFPYATGGHHFSNGRIWIEQLSKELRLGKDSLPALQVTGALNYAFGGAQACDSPQFPSDDHPFDLAEQVDLFLASGGASMLARQPTAPLVVVFVGGNDVRQDLQKTGGSGAIVGCAIAGVLGQIQRLAIVGGAQRFLVANVPDAGLSPAIQALGEPAISGATALAGFFNDALAPQLAALEFALGVQIVTFDVEEALNKAIEDDRFTTVDQACITPLASPFQCLKPQEYLFWDGIHPTRAGHEVLKEQALVDLAAATPPLVQ